jgi:hypothetical protein
MPRFELLQHGCTYDTSQATPSCSTRNHTRAGRHAAALLRTNSTAAKVTDARAHDSSVLLSPAAPRSSNIHKSDAAATKRPMGWQGAEAHG